MKINEEYNLYKKRENKKDLRKGGNVMKKLLIGMLITSTLGLFACGKTNTDNSSTNNNAHSDITEGMDSNNNMMPETSLGSDMGESKRNIQNLYTEFKSKVDAGVDKVKVDEWDKYKTEFQGEISNIRNTVKDSSLTTTLDDMENLFNEYDRAISEKVDVAKDKVEEMKNRIENSLK